MLNIITTKVTQKAFDLTPQQWRHRIRDIIPIRLAHRIKALVSEQQLIHYQDTSNPAVQLEIRLWGGFSHYALKDLRHLQSTTEDKQTRLLVSWALARWDWARGDYESAYQHLQTARQFRSLKKLEQSLLLLESDCLVQLNQHEKARELLTQATWLHIKNAHVLLSIANTYPAGRPEDDRKRLEIINQVLHKKKLTPLTKQQPEKPLGLDNLSTTYCKAKITPPSQPLITVIMPAYKAAHTLPFALESLLTQSWQNIEVIIVDDCSPDATYQIAQEYAARVTRVTALQLPYNQGAYSCRNFALQQANGTYITTHDADDWSHPQKLEIQATHLIKNPKIKANITDWVRALPNLMFRGTSRPSERMVQMNHSSLMLSRELLNAMGGWDNVRIAADTELIWRLGKFPGGSRPTRLHIGIPLSFALEDPSSLTRFSDTHVRTIYYGTRQQYRSAIKYWHCHTEPAKLISSKSNEQRSFPAPGIMLPKKKIAHTYDVVHIMDFNSQGNLLSHVYKTIQSDIQNKSNVAIFHWPDYQSGHFSHLLPIILQPLINDKKLDTINCGDIITTEEIIIWGEISTHIPEPKPNIKLNKLQLCTFNENQEKIITKTRVLTKKNTLHSLDKLLPDLIKNKMNTKE